MITTYNNEEVLNKTLEYFQGDQLAADVWMSKYALLNKEQEFVELNPMQMHIRLAKEFARIQASYSKDPKKEEAKFTEEYTDLFKDFKYIVPQGSPMSAIGNPYRIQSLSNCFVIDSPENSYGGILKTDQELVQLAKRRGGIGVDISTLCPEGTPVNNAAKTSTGMVSFMSRFSNSIREVAQNGRRGALMLTASIHHPDIDKFITVKQDLTKVTGANISVMVTNDFMNAVKNDEEYTQYWPLKGEPKIKKQVRARDIWNLLMKAAHASAEPGIIFIDNYHNNYPGSGYEMFLVLSTNPCCFSVDSRVDVITQTGLKDIKDITERDLVWIDTEEKFVPTSGYFSAGQALVKKVTFTNGDLLEITDNHKLAKVISKRVGTKLDKSSFQLVQLKDLKVGDEIKVSKKASKAFGDLGSYEEGLILGWLSGNGCLSYANSEDSFPTMYLDFWEKEHLFAEQILSIIHSLGFKNKILESKNNGNKVKRIASCRLTQYFTEKYETNLWRFRTKRNDFLYKASEDFIKGYLTSYFTANGTVEIKQDTSTYLVSLSSIDKDRLFQIQSLLTLFGIESSISLSKTAGSNANSSFKNSKDCHRLIISEIDNLSIFKKEIGFQSKKKQQHLNLLLSFSQKKSYCYTKIKNIETIGIKEVGCIEVSGYNFFSANSIVSGNSEIGMQGNDSCRLLLQVLYNYVVDPFTNRSYFDWNKFKAHTKQAMRLGDNLIDLELELIEKILAKIDNDPEPDSVKAIEKNLWIKIKEQAIQGRRVGLGLNGLGDCLAALGLTYGSDQSIKFVDELFKQFAVTAHSESIQLAKERGAFKAWDIEKEKDNPYLERIFKYCDQETIEDYKKYGRRNIACLTLAPSGSVSILAQVSSGIEPMFMPYYKRRRKVTDNDKSPVHFIDATGDKWTEYLVLHHHFKTWINITYPDKYDVDNFSGDDTELVQELFESSPYYKSTAMDVDWVKSVDIQAAAQKWIDHSISKTCNLPSDATVELVSDVYMRAWETGCKGFTIYRDGSRSGVLVAATDKKKEDLFEYKDAHTRPEVIDCDLHFSNVKGQKWIIIVGLVDQKPYEVFGGKLDEELESILKEVLNSNTLKLRKRKKKTVSSKYDLFDNNRLVINDVIDELDNPDYAILTRFVSLSLRHGAKPNFISEQLKKDKDNSFNSFAKVLARNLKKYISDGEKVSSGKMEDCDQGETCNLIYQDGCVTCTNCGKSKCD